VSVIPAPAALMLSTATRQAALVWNCATSPARACAGVLPSMRMNCCFFLRATAQSAGAWQGLQWRRGLPSAATAQLVAVFDPQKSRRLTS